MVLNKISWNNIKSKPVSGIYFIVGYLGINFFINYKLFQYVKKNEFNINNNYNLMIYK